VTPSAVTPRKTPLDVVTSGARGATSARTLFVAKNIAKAARPLETPTRVNIQTPPNKPPSIHRQKTRKTCKTIIFRMLRF